MSNDLYHFHESDLNECSLKKFYDSLPNQRLQITFRKSLHCYINNTNVLQGYRGPSHMRNGDSGDSEELSSSHGLQEIKFWYGTTKWINAVPGYGTLFYGLARGAQKADGQLDWSSLYFDSKTGECLSHDKDEAAEKLNKIGLRLFKDGKYSEAAKYHNNAYRACSNGYHNEQTFLNNSRKAESKSKEQSSNYDSYYEPRRSSGESASRNSNHYCSEHDVTYSTNERYYGDRRRWYNENEDWERYESERHVSSFYREWDELCRRGNYGRAEAIFHRLSTASPLYEPARMCFERILAGRSEQDAMELNAQGDYLFAQGEYRDAQIKYQQAFDKSRLHSQRQKYETNYEKALAENTAESLNCEGDQLFKQGKYSEAQNKYQEAFDKSKVWHTYQTYFVNKNRAKAEIDAMKLNHQGDDLCNQSEYDEALNNYRQAYNTSRVSAEKQIYDANMVKARAEINAKNLNAEGDNLFQQDKYSEAQSKYQEACNLSQIDKEKIKYAANRDKAKAAVDGAQSNSEGCHLYEIGSYSAAEKKFEQAHNTVQTDKYKKLYANNRSIAQREIDALQLYSEGENSLEQRKYIEAHRKFQDARNKSKATAQIEKFKAMEDKAKIEIDAIQLNCQGDDLFNQSKYDEALNTYRQACNTSQNNTEKQIYNANIVKAQAEVDARKLNCEGDNLLQQGKYSDAQNKYQEAYRLSQIEKEKIIYAANRDKAQNIIIKLEMLDTLWKQAWDAENNQSDEADVLFARILSESKCGLEICPGNSKLIQYETLVTLKLEGNELFNQGLECQLNGLTLFEEALQLKQRENYESANIKFKQAKMKFLDAQEKFEKGKQEDPRFSPCIEFVKERIEIVTDSIKSTEQFMLSQGLHNLHVNDDSDNKAATHSHKTDEAKKQINYTAQI